MAKALPPPPLCILKGHTTCVTALCFLPKNKFFNICNKSSFLISGSQSGEIFIWNLEENRTKFKLSGHDGKMITWLSHCDTSILSQAKDNFVNIWSYSKDKWTIIRRILSSETGFCTAYFLPLEQDGMLSVPGEKNSINITKYNSDCSIAKFVPENHGMNMCIKLFTLKNKIFVLCGHEDGSITLWNCENDELISTLSCHKEPVFCFDFDPVHRFCGISGSADDTILEWKIDSDFQLIKGRENRLINPGVNAIVIRPDGKIFITGGWDSSIRVFSWKTLKPLAVLKFHSNSVMCLAFSGELIGKKTSVFASGSKDNNIVLWSIY